MPYESIHLNIVRFASKNAYAKWEISMGIWIVHFRVDLKQLYVGHAKLKGKNITHLYMKHAFILPAKCSYGSMGLHVKYIPKAKAIWHMGISNLNSFTNYISKMAGFLFTINKFDQIFKSIFKHLCVLEPLFQVKIKRRQNPQTMQNILYHEYLSINRSRSK